MRRILALGALLAMAGLAAPAAAAPDPIRIPLCDLEGHCDRACYVSVSKPYMWCAV